MPSINSCKNCSILFKREQISFEASQFQYRSGDKVIHLVNDAEVNVFNGDLGYITDLIPVNIPNPNKTKLSLILTAMRSLILEMNGIRFVLPTL